jgi:hypothetical protein
MGKKITAGHEILISGNPVKYDFHVTCDKDGKQSRTVDLQLKSMKPSQIFLCFADISRIQYNEGDTDYREFLLPMSMLADILYLLNKWQETYISIGFVEETKEVRHFNFNSVK